MTKITGLWKKQSRTGETYYTGQLGGVVVVVFANKNKQSGDNQPEFELYFRNYKPSTTSTEMDEGDNND